MSLAPTPEEVARFSPVAARTDFRDPWVPINERLLEDIVRIVRLALALSAEGVAHLRALLRTFKRCVMRYGAMTLGDMQIASAAVTAAGLGEGALEWLLGKYGMRQAENARRVTHPVEFVVPHYLDEETGAAYVRLSPTGTSFDATIPVAEVAERTSRGVQVALSMPGERLLLRANEVAARSPLAPRELADLSGTVHKIYRGPRAFLTQRVVIE